MPAPRRGNRAAPARAARPTLTVKMNSRIRPDQKTGIGRAEQREEPGGVIGQPVAPAARPARRGRCRIIVPEDHRGDDQLERCRQALGDIGQHRTVGAKGDPEVTLNQIADIDGILLGQAAVEAPALLGGGDDVGISAARSPMTLDSGSAWVKWEMMKATVTTPSRRRGIAISRLMM